jgi:hypothetical protein
MVTPSGEHARNCLLEYANYMFAGSDNDIESVWADLLDKAGSGEERKRRKKTKKWNNTTSIFPPWLRHREATFSSL